LRPARSDPHNASVHISERLVAGRVGLAALAFLLAAQFLSLQYVGEPYPALLMPSFRGVVDADSVVSLEVLEVVVGQHVFGTADLFSSVPDQMRQSLTAILKPAVESSLDRPALYRLLPKLRVARANYARRIEAPEVRTWLRGRLETLTEGTVQSAEIRWVDRQWTADGPRSRAVVESTVVTFDRR
jgi:hypothetical protein